MPSLVVMVVEEDHVRQMIIVIDDVGEVNHCFVAFVDRDG